MASNVSKWASRVPPRSVSLLFIRFGSKLHNLQAVFFFLYIYICVCVCVCVCVCLFKRKILTGKKNNLYTTGRPNHRFLINFHFLSSGLKISLFNGEKKRWGNVNEVLGRGATVAEQLIH